MIRRVGSVTIFVRDKQAAKTFYTEVLGLEVHDEGPMPEGDALWLVLAPPGAETVIVLYRMDEDWTHYEQTMGKFQAITLQVADLQATAATLRERGVQIIQEPTEGGFMIIADLEGNSIMLVDEMLATQDD